MDPVLNFAATAGDGTIILGWQMPDDASVAGVKIQSAVATGEYPADYNQGYTVVDMSGAQGGTYTYIQTEDHNGIPLVNGTTYYYGAFAYDESETDWSSAVASAQDIATATAKSTLPTSSGFTASDFESGIGWGSQLVLFDQKNGPIEIPLLPNGEVY